ncbi:hypothetical protein HK100_004284 [Physocladia obscura]|uniref:G protein-coupled receptor n=1 Tax=Physocladia obscura TaxID=109957 RepID=A0AAD5SUL3_9FUNG|nr:hypothetical protein HK100_004284 [Physocladia obscura]
MAIQDVIQLVVFMIGASLNGSIMLILLVHHSELLHSNYLNRRLMMLIGACFIWCVQRAVQNVFVILGMDLVGTNWFALTSNLIVLLLLVSNTNLAAERYFLLRAEGRSRYFVTIYAIFIVIAVSMLVEFVMWPSIDEVHPTTLFGLQVWIIISSISFGVASILMTYFYGSAYRFTATQLNLNPRLVTYFLNDADHNDPEVVHNARMKLERKVLSQCVILSASLIFCYFPFWIYNIVFAVYGGYVPGDDDQIGWSAVLILLSLDVLVTPCLVLALNPDISKKLSFWES